MQLRLLEYYVVLAREKHFARAAAACNVTQPALSAGLVALEGLLGKRLVERDRRFIALTADGAAILPWAQQIVAMLDGLHHAADATAGTLRGDLRLGAIPASMPVVGLLVQTVRAGHPDLTVSVRSLTSREIERGLAAFELDAGVTYLDHEPPAQVVSVPLYSERAIFLTRAGGHGDGVSEIPLGDAVSQPLCLLHEGMQNRRILDAHLAARGLAVHPCATADSYVALVAMVESGAHASIVPDAYASLLPTERWARVIPFDIPLPPSRIGLIVSDRSPISQLPKATVLAARNLVLPPSFSRE
ncbi:LysR family transcriptional regulator [Brevundimonas sp.]|uniref:LysR family transcriptional regulator n=1 Tax=Brevundimonas sp. TaxID=1871086 RepID=UPI001A35B0AC|nr:LysR family transcriptional regulator [Brevundimonas sp.]MBJ7486712.1 LysR family transcriptional regulator [Brevundimonas sp.]